MVWKWLSMEWIGNMKFKKGTLIGRLRKISIFLMAHWKNLIQMLLIFFGLAALDIAGMGGFSGAMVRQVQPSTVPIGTFALPKASVFQDAVIAKNAMVKQVIESAGSNKELSKVVGVIAARNKVTGKIAVGIRTDKNSCEGCVENIVYKKLVKELGGNPADIEFTNMVRPNKRTGEATVVPVCKKCEQNYGRAPFKESGVKFQSDGAENRKINIYDSPVIPAPDSK